MLWLYLLGQNCLHLTFEQNLSSETYSRKYEKLPNIVILACKKYRKNAFVQNVWPANLALFIYVSTHCVETFKVKDFYHTMRLNHWNNKAWKCYCIIHTSTDGVNRYLSGLFGYCIPCHRTDIPSCVSLRGSSGGRSSPSSTRSTCRRMLVVYSVCIIKHAIVFIYDNSCIVCFAVDQ